MEKVAMSERRPAELLDSAWGWEEHQRAQRRRFARVSLADKIAWLEEAHRMVLTLAQQRSRVAEGTQGDHEAG